MIRAICLYTVIPVALFGLFTLSPLVIAVAMVMGAVIYVTGPVG